LPIYVAAAATYWLDAAAAAAIVAMLRAAADVVATAYADVFAFARHYFFALMLSCQRLKFRLRCLSLLCFRRYADATLIFIMATPFSLRMPPPFIITLPFRFD